MSNPVRVCFVGSGGMAQSHYRKMFQQPETTQVVVVCEPSKDAYKATCATFKAADLPPPPNEPDLRKLLKGYAGKLDAAFIITPHSMHHDQTTICLEAGLDVLLEKPMVLNAAEAESLIRTRDRSGKLLVVAFQGGLSPQIRWCVQRLRAGEFGRLLGISGTVWQDWGPNTAGTWRQVPGISGGGFLFDTGAHMLNTVSDLAGEDFDEVAAWLDNNGRPVDILGSVMGRLKSGAMVTIHASGETVPSCASEIFVFCTKAILRTGQWGERLSIQRAGSSQFRPVKLPPMQGAWEQFLGVRAGQIPNPCPPEVGLRMARLWDAIRASAAQGGIPVKAGDKVTN